MPKPIQPDNIKKIVLFRTDRIGEVLLSTVCIGPLKRHFPKSSITFVVSDYAQAIISGRKDISRIFLFNTIKKGSIFHALKRLIPYLKSEKFDLAIVMNPHKTLHLACLMAGIKYRLGYNQKYGFCLTHKIENKKIEGKKHELEYNMDLLRSIGVEADIEPPYIVTSANDDDYADKIIRQYGLNNAKSIVAIHAGSSNPEKKWPVSNFASLANKIKSNFGCNVVFLGAPEDKGAGECDLAGLFNIKQLSAFLKKCSLFIGNDAGPMHVAAAANIPVIALFGGVSFPKRWRPWGEGNVLLYKDDINKISVDEVFEAVKQKI